MSIFLPKKDATRFHDLSIAAHWVMLVLLAAVYTSMELRGIFPKGSDPREAMKTWHYMLGLSVFVLVWLRLLARLFYGKPAIDPIPPKWQIYAARAMHIALYALMISMPMIGWVLLSAEGKPVPFFGWQLPAFVSENEPLAEQIEELHEAIGTAGYFLIGAHALAALYHHYVVRDNTLRRMLPHRSR